MLLPSFFSFFLLAYSLVTMVHAVTAAIKREPDFFLAHLDSLLQLALLGAGRVGFQGHLHAL
jgi:hypothetical protein